MGQAPEQTLEQFDIGSKKLAKLGTVFVSLAGGEPLLRPDVVEIARLVSRYHVTFLTTNGWDMTPELARDLYRAKLWGVSISLDYADPARHDRRRGKPGRRAGSGVNWRSGRLRPGRRRRRCAICGPAPDGPGSAST